MPSNAATIMNRLLVREKHSLLQYLNDAWPWTPGEDQPALERLRKLGAAEQEQARRIAEWMQRQLIMASSGRFPQEFTAMNYVGLDHLLPRLVKYERWATAETEKDLRELDDAEARGLVQAVLAAKRGRLAELEALAAEHAAPKLASTRR